MARYLFVRHGAPEIEPGRCYGRLDIPLSAQAVGEMPGMAARLAAIGPRRVHASPARRCRELAEAIGGAIPVLIDPRLRELDFGAWEGLPWDAVPRVALDAWAADPLGFAPPGGETGAALVTRVAAAWRDFSAADEDCVVISHGGPLRLLLALARGKNPDLLAPSPPVGSITEVRV